MGMQNVQTGFLIHTLELKLWPFEVFPICLYMRLQCFSPTRYVSVRYLETRRIILTSVYV